MDNTGQTPSANPAAPAAATAAAEGVAPGGRTPTWRWLGHLALVLVAPGLLLLAGLGAGLWWWSGSDGSLGSALRLGQALLPASMQLQVTGAQGSLRQGGRIADLHWQQGGLSVRAQQVQLTIDLPRLWQGQLPLRRLEVAELDIDDQRSASAAAPLGPLVWPLQVALDWQIGTLRWQKTPEQRADALQGHYAFDGQEHRLQLEHLQWAQGLYSGQLRLQGQGPMQLDAQLQGQLQVSNTAGRPLPPLQAQLSVNGPLGASAARLQLKADMRPQQGQGARLQAQGELHPQRDPALVSLQAQLQGVDLAALWPSAPRTQIDGQLQLKAQNQGWRLSGELDNRLTGPLDQDRVPLRALQGTLVQHAQGWQIEQMLARWPGGQLQGQGQWQAQRRAGQWRLQGLQPQQWWSSLAGPTLDGQIALEQLAADHVLLRTQLAPGDADPKLRSQAPSGVRAELHWQAGVWRLSALDLQWMDLRLQAQGRWVEREHLLEVSSQWRLPGLQGQIDGAMSPEQGQGQWRLDAAQIVQLQAWLQRWPGLARALKDLPLPASASASGQWQGGWSGEGMRLQARLQLPEWQLQARGQLLRPAQSKDWQGQLVQLEASRRGAAAERQPLQLQLASPLEWQWLAASGRAPGRFKWGAHPWLLQDRQAMARLQLEAGEAHTGIPDGLPRLRLRARLLDLPARWSGWLGLPETPGDLRLQGALALDTFAEPRMLASLERSSGDLLIEAGAGQPVQAGVRQARAQLRIEGQQALFDLDWDSAQAGQAEARLHSQLTLGSPTGLSGLWPAQAPLGGKISARFPRIGGWSWLAPPGWRVQGALDVQATLSGTREAIDWNGRLQADDLAVRSAVQGVEFRQGRLRAQLQKQQMVLEEFSLKGAGAQGGSVWATGVVRWPAGQRLALNELAMELQMQAQGLRVSQRADRRLSLSGQVGARLQGGQMQLRGHLEADSALFILPEDSAPSLDKDVVIARTGPAPSGPAIPKGLSIVGVPDVQVLLRLGPDFQLRGQGIDTRLAGELKLTSNEATAGEPRLHGEVRTEGGRYEAYGQELRIEKGLLRFAGPYDNPALDLLALRPNLPQTVGVRVTGTAMAPRVRLHAEPDMPDADKLAWLLLGRSPAAGGTESALLQQAALALLGENVRRPGSQALTALGFDTVSLGTRTTTSASGTTATGTALMLGKRLSRDFYLAYESSVSGAFGNLFIFYDLSRKLTLRAQTGEYNALDLIYTVRKD